MPISLKESLARKKDLPRSDEIIRCRAELLPRADRDLIEAVLIHGHPTRSLARMMGTTPRAVRDRARRLARRLVSKRFLYVARALPYLSPQDSELAKRYFCQGATHRQLCGEVGMTLHALRRRLDRIAAQVETVRRLNASSRMMQRRPQDA